MGPGTTIPPQSLVGGSWHHHSTTESRHSTTIPPQSLAIPPPFHPKVSPFHHHSTPKCRHPKSRHSTTIPPQSLTIPPPFHPWGWGWGCGCGCGWGWVGVRGWGWPPGRLLGVSWAVGCPLLVLLGGVFWFSLVFLRFCLVFLAWGASSGSRPFLLGLGPGAWRSWIGLLGGVLAPSGRLLGARRRLLAPSGRAQGRKPSELRQSSVFARKMATVPNGFGGDLWGLFPAGNVGWEQGPCRTLGRVLWS